MASHAVDSRISTQGAAGLVDAATDTANTSLIATMTPMTQTALHWRLLSISARQNGITLCLQRQLFGGRPASQCCEQFAVLYALVRLVRPFQLDGVAPASWSSTRRCPRFRHWCRHTSPVPGWHR